MENWIYKGEENEEELRERFRERFSDEKGKGKAGRRKKRGKDEEGKHVKK